MGIAVQPGSEGYKVLKDIETATESMATAVSSSALVVKQPTAASLNCTEASAANILAALNKLVPVTSGQYSVATGAADAEIVLATQNISSANGLLVSISEDAFIAFKQATGGATTATDIFKAGTHYIPFTCTHIVHKQVTSAGTITVIGKSTA